MVTEIGQKEIEIQPGYVGEYPHHLSNSTLQHAADSKLRAANERRVRPVDIWIRKC